MAKLLLTDLDGTLREPASGKKFISSPLDQKIIHGADKALAHYYERGWTIVGISNQAGVEAGHKSLDDAIAEQRYTLELLPHIEVIFFCPDFEGRDCWSVGKNRRIGSGELGYAFPFVGTYRKPNPGMLQLARALYHSPQGIWYVGDRPEDEEAATRAGINFMWADMWLSRFRPGVHEFNVTAKQIEFLEGIELRDAP